MADSFNLDLHKWMGMPVGTSIVYVSKRYSYLNSFSFDQVFLDYQNMEYNLRDQCQMGIEGTRRLYGLRVWAALSLIGFDNIKQNIIKSLDIAEYLKLKLSEVNKVEVIENTGLTVVLFKIIGYNKNKLHNLTKDLYKEEVVFITVSEYKKQPVLRCCISNFETSSKDVDYVVERIAQYIE